MELTKEELGLLREQKAYKLLDKDTEAFLDHIDSLTSRLEQSEAAMARAESEAERVMGLNEALNRDLQASEARAQKLIVKLDELYQKIHSACLADDFSDLTAIFTPSTKAEDWK